MVRFSD